MYNICYSILETCLSTCPASQHALHKVDVRFTCLLTIKLQLALEVLQRNEKNLKFSEGTLYKLFRKRKIRQGAHHCYSS
jgi:hypothetical protein